MYTTMERRNKPRIYCDCPAIIQCDEMPGVNFNDECRLLNLSASGLYVMLNRNFEHGSKVSVTVNLTNSITDPDAPKLATKGTVVRIEPQADGCCGIAVKFHNYRFL